MSNFIVYFLPFFLATLICFRYPWEMRRLVALLQKSFKLDDNPLSTAFAVEIVRKIYKENEQSFSDLKREDFLARAKEILDNDESGSDHACPLCFRTYTRKKNMDMHVKSVHEQKESEEFKCSSCGKAFMSGTSLNYHKDTAHADSTAPEVKCKICNRVFRHKQILQRHNKSVHKKGSKSGELLCKEKDCGKSFTRRDSLNKHIQTIHMKVNFAFGKAKRMSAHKGGFKCKMCDEKFYGEGAEKDFKFHIIDKCKTVTGVECEECGAPFTNQQNLKKHKIIKHSRAPVVFSCTFCNFTSKYENSLNRHRNRKHKNDWEEVVFVCTVKRGEIYLDDVTISWRISCTLPPVGQLVIWSLPLSDVHSVNVCRNIKVYMVKLVWTEQTRSLRIFKLLLPTWKVEERGPYFFLIWVWVGFPEIFDPKLTRPKPFQIERTWRLACLPSFCELVT